MKNMGHDSPADFLTVEHFLLLTFFIFDPGIRKRMGKVIDCKSVKKLEFEVIDEHMKRQNIGFFKQGFCVSIIHFRVYKTNRNFLFKKKTVKITCSC